MPEEVIINEQKWVIKEELIKVAMPGVSNLVRVGDIIIVNDMTQRVNAIVGDEFYLEKVYDRVREVVYRGDDNFINLGQEPEPTGEEVDLILGEEEWD